MKRLVSILRGCALAGVVGLGACASNNQPQSANQAVNQQRAASAAPYGYACYDDFGQPVYYYDSASPGFCSNRPVYVVQERPRAVYAPSRDLPTERVPLPIPNRIGVLGR